MPGQYNNRNSVARDSDDQYRKLFIGGLCPNTESDALQNFYSKWGELSDYVVMKDKHTGRSRCFGFVTFKESDALETCMKERPHIIDDRQVEPKRAAPRESLDLTSQQTVNKLFLGGYKDSVSEDALREHFENFGEIECIEIISDDKDGRKRGFVFITFKDYDPVDKACMQRLHEINGVRMEAKKAISKEKMAQLKHEQHARGMYGGGYGGGGGGGYPPHGGYSSSYAAGGDAYYNRSGGDPYSQSYQSGYSQGYERSPYGHEGGYGSYNGAPPSYSSPYASGDYGGGPMRGPMSYGNRSGPYGGQNRGGYGGGYR